MVGEGEEQAVAPGATQVDGSLVQLEVPVAASYVALARTVVIASAAVVPWVDDDRLDDLRLAVSEACTWAMSATGEDPALGRLRLRCELDGDWLRVRVEELGGRGGPAAGDGERLGRDHGGPVGEDDEAWGTLLVRALVDEAAFDAVARRVELAVCRSGPS